MLYEVITLSLSCEGKTCGEFVVFLPPGAGEAEHAAARNLAELLRCSLETLIASELGRRCIASETLDKYREIELLHQATQSLNTSLRLRDVTRALIEECRRGAIPAEMGLVFLKEKGTVGGQHVDSFGPADETRLDVVRTSRLYKEAMARGAGEIVNDLSGDSYNFV